MIHITPGGTYNCCDGSLKNIQQIERPRIGRNVLFTSEHLDSPRPFALCSFYNKRWNFAMSTYTKIRLLLGLGAIFAFVYMLNGMPCLGDANEFDSKVSSIHFFQDNGILSTSTDVISLGQDLVVPKLIDSELEKINIWGIFPSSMFEKVESIGRRHISADSQQANQYIVREGDSLWSIAGEQLGNGSRYKEISKLNADVLKDENDLTVGMRLSLPDR